MLEWASLISLVVLVTLVIARACDRFEIASDYLGRNMPAGIKGATINAMGSSMPELLTTFALLIIGSFAAGVSVTAGSAVFNSAIIPLFVILAVMVPHTLRLITLGVVMVKNDPVNSITIDKKSVTRDVVALLIAEIGLIYILGKPSLDWTDGLFLILMYIPYMVFMWVQNVGYDAADDGEYSIDNRQAWTILGGAILVLSFACFLLGEAIIECANMLGIHPMVSALFLGAAVSSVPDTILSVKDAIKGNYEDAIGNALGSNTFDICVALGLPLFTYTLIAGPVPMPDHDAVQVLRVGLLVFTVIIAGLLLIPKFIKLWQAKVLFAVYVIWALFALNTEFGWV